MANHTEGPWEWAELGGALRLCTPNRGRIIVMDAIRNGARAELRFGIRDKSDQGGLMRFASELVVAEHPDARLMAAAPELLAACESWMAFIKSRTLDSEDPMYVAMMEYHASRIEQTRAAIAKAKGGVS